jgi:hypothetical protein
VSKYLSSIWVQPETPLLWQEAPDVTQETPDDLQEIPDNLQETPDVPQEDVNDRQGDNQVRQVDIKMGKYSWRDLPFDKEANAQLLDHLCRRSSEKGLVKPGKPDLFKILLKYIVASGDLTIVRFEEGIPILRRGDTTHVTGDVTATDHDVTTDVTAAQERDLTIGSQSHSQSQSLQPCHGQTPTQLAHAEVRLDKVALDKATRTAQERSQDEAQEVERKKQEATADSKKSKKEERYKAAMDKLERLPPCPKLSRGKKCTGISCGEEKPGFPHSHINNMVVCMDKAHVSMATRARCQMFHLWQKRSPRPPPAPPAGPPAGHPAKNSGGGTSGARQAPKTPRRKGERDPTPAAAASRTAAAAAAAAAARPRTQEGD